MNTKQISIGITAAVILASSALVFAADAPKKPLGKLTCEDFIGIDDVIKPQYVIAAVAGVVLPKVFGNRHVPLRWRSTGRG